MPQLLISSVSTPVGVLSLTDQDGAIIALDWGRAQETAVSSPLLDEAKQQVRAYFEGDLRDFDLPLAPRGTTYQQSVWQALSDIPAGRVRSYQEVAISVKSGVSGGRAVGGACRANPIPLIIPCHRVIAKDGSLRGYAGDGGLQTKAWLLTHEGVDGRRFRSR